MKKLFYSLVLMLMISPIFAQNAEQILDKVSNHYKNQKSLYLKFESKLQNTDTHTKDSYNGEIYVKGDKYNLSVPKVSVKQIFDGKKLYTIDSDAKEVTVSKPEKGSDELFTPTSVLDIYKNGFKLSLGKKSGATQYIKLVPTKDSELKYILVGVNTQTSQLVSLEQMNKNNTSTTFRITKELQGVIIPRSFLSFNKKFFKDYYISEL